jgi:hypothetical protein
MMQPDFSMGHAFTKCKRASFSTLSFVFCWCPSVLSSLIFSLTSFCFYVTFWNLTILFRIQCIQTPLDQILISNYFGKFPFEYIISKVLDLKLKRAFEVVHLYQKERDLVVWTPNVNSERWWQVEINGIADEFEQISLYI